MESNVPEGYMGPPDQLAPLLLEAITHLLLGDDVPYLWKIGGYYVWWDYGRWWRDGMVQVDETFVRRELWKASGVFEWLD